MIEWPGKSTISFNPALPCCTWQGDVLCGKPATVATLYPTGGGMYIMQPICRDCVAALERVYFPDEKASEQ